MVSGLISSKRLFTHLVLASALVLTATACDVKSSDRVVPVEPTDPNSPNNKPEIDLKEGSEADFSALGQTDRRETYFEKPYDRADLQAVLGASGYSTLSYAARLGIDVYRVPRVDKNKPVYFYTLNFPPTEFDDLWKEQSGGLGETVQLEGLYFDACPLDYNCEERRVVRPTVLLNEAGDRWTLVHEMVHYMFNAQRKTDALADVQTFERQREASINRAVKLMDAYKELPNRQDLMSVAKELDNLARLTRGRLVVKEFEETAVENLLIDEWVAKRLAHVPFKSVENAVWYMNYGRKNGLQLLDALSQSLQSVRQEADQKFYPEVSQQIRTTEAYIAQIRSSTYEMIRRAERITGVSVPNNDVKPRIVIANGKLKHVEHDHRNCMGSEEERKAWLKDIGRISAATRF